MKDFNSFFRLNPNINLDKIAIAFSGGSDSLCLLYLLSKKFDAKNLVALYVNHSLRGEQELSEESFLNSDNCKKLGIKYIELHCDKGEIEEIAKLRDSGLEDAARAARYAKLLGYCNEHKINTIATAHNSDDQVETMIMRTFNGASPLSLSCVKSVTRLNGVDVIRPTLSYSKKDLEVILKENNLKWSEDSTNGEQNYLRNKIRWNIVPLIEEVFPSVSPIVQRNAELLEGFSVLVMEKVNKLIKKNKIKKDVFCNQVTIVRYNIILELTKQYQMVSINQLKHIDNVVFDEIETVINFNTFTLVIDEDGFINFNELIEDKNFTLIIEEKGDGYFNCPYSTLQINSFSQANKMQLQIADEDLKHPLIFRSVKSGDQLVTSGGKVMVNKLISSWKIDESKRKLVYILEDRSGIVAVFAHHVGGRDRLAVHLKNTLVGKSVRIYSILNKEI